GDGWTGQYEKFTWNKETEELRGDNGKLVELTSEKKNSLVIHHSLLVLSPKIIHNFSLVLSHFL
ncbi:MAG: hypothetical protein J6D10_04605, partial [Clostridia bacterium]|nr:hypothetical protein [Clostridia bacterium]